MTTRVLVVDDSGFFRRRLVELINGGRDLEVVGTAANGREAIEQARRLRPDVITMDYEMPVMDGITAVREITRTGRIPILMFSSLTQEGARVTLDALEAGAVDYLPKNFDELSRSPQEVQKILCERITTIAASTPLPREETVEAPLPEPPPPPPRRARRSSRCSLIVVGASTGGPMALQTLLTALPAKFPVPLLLVQHMPASFTRAFAERLDRGSRIRVSEAADGDFLDPGHAYLAPGGRQTLIEHGARNRIRVRDADDRVHFRPSIDVTLGSAANELSSRVLGIVLTGMGSDGREGARVLRQKGGRIWTQDEASCVIYGMPQAIAAAGLADEVFALAEFGHRLIEEVS